MKKPRQNRQPEPSFKGKMICSQGHQWLVSELNRERVTVKCPVCGGLTEIKKAKQ